MALAIRRLWAAGLLKESQVFKFFKESINMLFIWTIAACKLAGLVQSHEKLYQNVFARLLSFVVNYTFRCFGTRKKSYPEISRC